MGLIVNPELYFGDAYMAKRLDVRGSLERIVEALADPTVKQRMRDIGQELWPREQQTPQALAAYQAKEIDKWWPVIKAANIKSE